MKHKLKMIWRIIRDRQVVVITEDHGRMYYDWNTRSLEDVCQMCRKVYDMAYMPREDIRGTCHKPCLYNDNGKCDMWDEISVPDETEKCDNQIDV